MNTFKIGISSKFLSAIIDGSKKWEFRLNNDFFKQIRVGDSLVLISSQDKSLFSKIIVKSMQVFSSWEEAISLHWDDSFGAFHETKEALIEECHRFYRNDDIKKYGLVGFEIGREDLNVRGKRVLLDTNIIIYRESHLKVSFEVASMYKWLDKLTCTKLIHPLTREEVSKYKDVNLRDSLLSKLDSYDEIVPNNDFTPDFKKIVEKYSTNANSQIDNSFLFQTFLGVSDFLITNDRVLLMKATDLYLRERVLSVDEFLKIIEDQNPKFVDYQMLSVRLKKIGEIDLSLSFFDTLKEDYGTFENWFRKKNGEHAYIFQENSQLFGFLYLKTEYPDEVYADIEPTFEKKKRLKVCTFKTVRPGFHLGERFLKIIFDNAKKRDVDEIYVTLFEDKRLEVDQLRDFIKTWGFRFYGTKTSTGESVFVKDMRQYNGFEDSKFNFPMIKEKRSYFFLPIEPDYHTDLFPDSILNNEDMNLYQENLAHRYSLEKIYVSGAFSENPKPGDIVVIYRNGDRWPKRYHSVVTSLAVIQEIVTPPTLQEFLDQCKNKSVFEQSELETFYLTKKYKKVIKLLLLDTFKKKIILDDLYDLNIVEEGKGPRPFDPITNEQFSAMIERTK